MKRTLRLLVPLALLLSSVVYAGGPFGAVGTTPRTYASSSFPLGYRTDQGNLGSFSNTAAISIASYAFGQWDNVLSASLSFVNAGSLARNVTSPSDSYIAGATQYSDGINPIIFDSDGSITDSIFGVGAKNSVLGFAGSAYVGTTYVEGKAVINGFLSGSGTTGDQQRYEATITHEIGHFLGLAHPQLSMHAVYPTLYPYIIDNAAQRTLDPDDTAAICQLYPAAGYTASVGSISGTVRRPDNSNLSGMNVVAEDSATGVCYSTVVDYFSGGDGPFQSPPSANGSYTIRGLAPGTYFVRIEPLKSAFVAGSSIGSYDPPPSSTQSVYREWYNGANESGDMLLDDVNRKTGVTVTAGNTTGNINIVSNESNTLSMITYFTTGFRRVFGLPSGAVTRFATRFTAPSQGSLVGIRLRIDEYSTMPTTGFLTIRIHQNVLGGLGGGLPGAVIDSTVIPYSYLAAHQDNDIYLRSLGTTMDFASGASFHVSISGSGVGPPFIQVDSALVTTNRSSYFDGTTWRSFGQGNSPYNVASNLIMSAIWSNQTVGTPVPVIGFGSTTLDFGRRRPGATSDRLLAVRNDGTDTLRVTSTTLGGINNAEFQITSGGGGFNVPPGDAHNIGIRFAPASASGAKSATITIVSNSAGSPHVVALTGEGVAPQIVGVPATLDFGNVKLGAMPTMDTVVIRNSGNDTLHISSIVLTGADAGTGITVVNSNAVIVIPGGTLRRVIRFAPTERRVYNARLVVHHDGTPDSTLVPITGTGMAGELTLGNSGYDFGTEVVGDTTGLTPVVIRNTGNAPLSILGAQVTSDAPSFTLDQLPASPTVIAAGDSIVLNLSFHPKRTGTFSTQVQVTSDAPTPTASFSVAGVGIAPQLIAPNTFSLGASRVSAPIDATLMVYNGGNAPLEITSLAISGTNMPDFTVVSPSVSPSLPAVLTPGDSLPVKLRFVPSALGPRTATLTIESNDPGGARTIDLAGTGIEGSLVVSTTIIDFDTVYINESAEQTLTVRNGGATAFNLAQLLLNGTNFSATPTDSRNLSPGDSVVVTVRFAPTGTPGPRTGAITVQLSAPDNSVVDVVLQGVAAERPSGVDPIITGDLRVEMLPVLPSPALTAAALPLRLIGAGRVDAEVSVVDIAGRTLLTPFTGDLNGSGTIASVQVPIDCSHLPAGSYVIVLRAGGVARTQTLVVVR